MRDYLLTYTLDGDSYCLTVAARSFADAERHASVLGATVDGILVAEVSATQRPLKPTYVNEKERVEEHVMFMRLARDRYPNQPICPDCYQPYFSCRHLTEIQT